RASTAPFEPSPGSMKSRLPRENPGKRDINQNEKMFKAVVQARHPTSLMSLPRALDEPFADRVFEGLTLDR
ncbi:MAG: hypothetical protein CBB71_09280, partial [Rhodopirellula sp. TMED11]